MRNVNANRGLFLCVLGAIAIGVFDIPAAKADDQAQRWRGYHQIMVDEQAWWWNRLPWDQEKIATFGDFQYTVYWDANAVFVLARRDLRDDTLQTLHIPEFTLKSDDRHRNTCLGMSPADGRLHLSWDHHGDQLRYAKSQAGFLTDPPPQISAADIGPAEPMLSNPALESGVTYPRFFNDNQGNLFFIYRIGSSGSGNGYLHRYDPQDASWTRLGRVFSSAGTYGPWQNSTSRNAYLHDILFDDNNRLHVTWVYRETGSWDSNHDLHYAYSDDQGLTWYNNAGQKIADLTIDDPIELADPGIVVWNIPVYSWLMNTGCMALDSKNRPHVVTFKHPFTSIPLHREELCFFHYWRSDDGTWHGGDPIPPGPSRVAYRGNAVFDRYDNIYFFYDGTMDGFWCLEAKASDQWRTWSGYPITGPEFTTRDASKHDRQRWLDKGILSFTGRVNPGNGFAILELVPPVPVEPYQPAPPALVAHYEFEDNTNDSSGYGHHGTAYGGPTYVNGKFGKAISFDGIDDYVDINDFDYTNDSNEFSLTFWFNAQAPILETATNGGFPEMVSHLPPSGSLNNLRVYFHAVTKTSPNCVKAYCYLSEVGEKIDYIHPTQLADGQWHMLAMTVSSSTGKVYIDGSEVLNDPNMNGASFNPTTNINLGRRAWADRYYGAAGNDDGLLDDLGFWSEALSAEDVAYIYANGIPEGGFQYPKAWNPVPDGSKLELYDVNLTWSPGWEGVGVDPVQHEVYFGTGFCDVYDADSTSHPDVNYFSVSGDVTTVDPGLLQWGQAYYWRVDEVYDVNSYKGDIWGFTVISPTASVPNPFDGAKNVPIEADLSWQPGRYQGVEPYLHEVYFGTDYNDVYDANSTSHPDVNYFSIDVNTLDPGPLQFGQTYYWRVDEVYDVNTYKGDIWSFTTMDHLVVDNMEDYYNDRASIRAVWQDSYIGGNGAASGSNVTVSTASDDRNPILAGDGPPWPVDEGSEAMQFAYDNDGSVTTYVPGFDPFTYTTTGYYSIITANTAGPNSLPINDTDWTKGDAKILSLRFYGDQDNDANETMYVKLNDSTAVAYSGDMNDIRVESWQTWLIPLDDFGIDLNNVNSMSIIFGEEGNTTTAGGSGVVFFDNISLLPRGCYPEIIRPLADIAEPYDCEVGYEDLELMAADWLLSDYNSIGGLVAHYEFEGNTNDSSGCGHHGTAYGNPTYAAGKFGQAINFDGVDDYVDIADFDYTNDLYEFSLTFWFKSLPCPNTPTNNSYPYVFSHGITNRNNSQSVQLRSIKPDNDEDPNRVRTVNRLADPTNISDTTSGTGELYRYTTTEQLMDGLWHMYALTVSSSDGGTIYIDGEPVSTNTDFGGAPMNPATDINLGRKVQDGTRYYGFAGEDHGLLDDVRIYNCALSASDIVALRDGNPVSGSDVYYPLLSPANLYDEEPPLSKKVNFMDFAILADGWLEKALWP